MMNILEKLESYDKRRILQEIWDICTHRDDETGDNILGTVKVLNSGGKLTFLLVELSEQILRGCNLAYKIRNKPIMDDTSILLTYDIEGDSEHYFSFSYGFDKVDNIEFDIRCVDPKRESNGMTVVAREIERLNDIISSKEFEERSRIIHDDIVSKVRLNNCTSADRHWIREQMYYLLLELYNFDTKLISSTGKLFSHAVDDTTFIDGDFPNCVFATYDSNVGQLYVRFAYDYSAIIVTIDNEPMCESSSDGFDDFAYVGESELREITIPLSDYLHEQNILSVVIQKVVDNLDSGETKRYNDVLAYRDGSLLYFYFVFGTNKEFVCVHEETKFILSCGDIEPFNPKPIDSIEGKLILDKLHITLLNEL